MKKHIFPLVMIFLTIILWVLFYPQLSEQLPTHWGPNGKANDYSPKLGAMLLSIGLMVLVYFITVFIPKMDPKKENYPRFTKSYHIINISLMIVAFAINIIIILSGLGFDLDTGIYINLILGALFIVIGNYLPQVKPNYFMGIKTPWALNDETNWKKTHRFGGKTFVISGIIFMCSIFLPKTIADSFLFPIVLIIILLPIGYSYWLFRKNV
ncbi:SdpI family protein [Cytobacillus sp. Hz8]|uniref:SdpI family protein n=1 Tax=Cytobacillus sp. Hz8 TaxID=3347168 RepID=UPI0035D71200